MRFRPGLGLSALFVASIAVSTARVAAASVEGTAQAGGGLGALGIRVDLANAVLRYRTCATAPCVPDAASDTVAITLARDDIPASNDVVVEVLTLGQGRSAVHVRVPSRNDPLVAWEAVLAAGAPPIFAAKTGLVEGQEGERSGPYVQILGDDALKHVLIGSVREDLHICGQSLTILSPTGLDPSTLALRGATVQRLPAEQRESAKVIIASAHGGPADPPLAPLLRAAGASSAQGSFKALTDGDPSTTWAEAKQGVGQGEFVMMNTSQAVPITRLSVVVAPPTGKASGAAPRTLFLVTDRQAFAVTLPEDGWMHPGAAYDIAFPDPVATSCLALVLDDKAYDHGRPHPEVTFSELYAYSAFDAPGATLGPVATALDGGGARAEAAAVVLEQAGAPGFTAMAAAYDKLDAAGRALAIHVAASAPSCESTAPLLIRAIGDSDREVRRKAQGKLESPVCGRAAVPALLAALDDVATREQVAPLAALLAPREALEPLAKAMVGGTPSARTAVRSAFAHAAARVPSERIATLLSDATRPADARLELVRGATGQLATVPAAADAVVDDLLRASPPMRTRFLLAEPLATLARGGDAHAGALFVALLARDPQGAVRARAVSLAEGIGAAEAALADAVRDPEPRVREAALRTLASAKITQAVAVALDALGHDAWTFVRTAAAAALAVQPPSPAIDAGLGAAIEEDDSPRVRASAVTALATRGAIGFIKPIRRRLDDEAEALDVRGAAARALGALCDAGAVDRLTKLARAGSDPLAEEATTQLSLAATEALGWIHPKDLASRLAPLRAKGGRELMTQAAAQALAEPARCR